MALEKLKMFKVDLTKLDERPYKTTVLYDMENMKIEGYYDWRGILHNYMKDDGIVFLETEEKAKKILQEWIEKIKDVKDAFRIVSRALYNLERKDMLQNVIGVRDLRGFFGNMSRATHGVPVRHEQ